MKNFLFSLLATVFFSNFFFAQEMKIVSGKISSGIESIDLPVEVKSDHVFKTESTEFTKHVRYSETLKGEVLIVTDSKDKIVAITVPSTTSMERIKNIFKCVKEAIWGTSGMGFWDCMLS